MVETHGAVLREALRALARPRYLCMGEGMYAVAQLGSEHGPDGPRASRRQRSSSFGKPFTGYSHLRSLSSAFEPGERGSSPSASESPASRRCKRIRPVTAPGTISRPFARKLDTPRNVDA